MTQAMIQDTTTAAFILIGNELLSGRTVDKNLPVLATRLAEVGIDIIEVRIIADDTPTIINTVNTLRKTYNYVFTSGGIGPTHDDITSESIAQAFNVPLECNAEAMKMLQSHYTPEELNEARQKMAYVPKGASLIENPVSKAPGFCMENVHVLAGVPRIFAAMLDFIIPTLDSDTTPIQTRTISSMKTEGEIAKELAVVQENYPTVNIGSYPYFKNGSFGVSLVLRSRDENALENCTEKIQLLVQGLRS